MLQRQKLKCDLCVVGGGLAGIAAAISAAREGIQVVLMHERPVLGGNASSEIRMWVCGAHGENNRETGIAEEIALENLYRNPTKSYAVWDTVLYDFVKREKNIELLLNCTCMDAKVSSGDFPHNRDTLIKQITGYQMTTQRFIDVEASFYCDSSGDSILAPLTGAHFRLGREASKEFDESCAIATADDMTMGMSCLLQGRETHRAITYKAPECSTKLTNEDFEHRMPDLQSDWENFWYLELGGEQDTIGDTELLRDKLLGLATGTWDYIKNSGKFSADNWELAFLGFLPGKRESRRMMGEYIITQKDITEGRVFDDEIAYGGWPLDDHFPGGFYHRGTPNTDIKTPAPYSLPYRALYSENVHNLFFAGRNISMTHMAMSSIRVMATCMLLGEAVGKAASIAIQNECSCHDVYLKHIATLQEKLLDQDCFLPSKKRTISPLCKAATLSATDALRNGQDRPHKLYDSNDATCGYHASIGENIVYCFPNSDISSVHIVFDSDLDRKTLPGSECERMHNTRSNERLDSPVMHMPKTLCRSFRLVGKCDGKTYTLLDVTDNRKRAWHLRLNRKFDELILVPLSSWGNEDYIRVISFDFNQEIVMNFSKRMLPTNPAYQFKDPGYHVWCGTMLKHNDTYFLIYSRWKQELGFHSWVTNSEICIAKSDDPLGEFTFVKKLFGHEDTNTGERFVYHNPTVLTLNGRFYLYFMYNRGFGDWWEHRNAQRIGVAHCDDPLGDWVIESAPIIDVSENGIDSLMVSNPSVTLTPNGKILMVYKAVSKDGVLPKGGKVLCAVAQSDNPLGPFFKYNKPIMENPTNSWSVEDPYIWWENDRFYALVKDFQGYFTNTDSYAVALFESIDGQDWIPAKNTMAFKPILNYGDTSVNVQYLERPQLYMENGIPKILLCACKEHNDNTETYNIRIPLL